MQKDFSYPLKIDTLNQQQQHYHLQADQAQCKSLKEILQVEDVCAFDADIYLKYHQKEHRLDIWGEVRATLELRSVISDENFIKEYQTSFDYYYDTSATYKDIREMEPSIYDDVPEIVENGEIDLGNVAIEQLALVMEDYPRKDGEVFEFVADFDPQDDKPENPFAVLKNLKK